MPVAKRGREGDGRRVAGRAGIRCRPDPQLCVGERKRVSVRRNSPGVDIVLGPEMRSTGEVMGVSERFSIAFAKSQLAAGILLPKQGRIFISVASPAAKEHMVGLAARLAAMGFQLMATEGTARVLEAGRHRGRACQEAARGASESARSLIDGQVQLIINTPRGKGARTDEGRIRAAAVAHGVPCITTIPAADACVKAMEALRQEEMTVQALQDRFPQTEATLTAVYRAGAPTAMRKERKRRSLSECVAKHACVLLALSNFPLDLAPFALAATIPPRWFSALGDDE